MPSTATGVSLRKPAVRLVADETGRAWSWIPPYAVGATYAVALVGGPLVISEVTYTPRPGGDEWTASVRQLGVAGSLTQAASQIATAYHRDYC